MTSGPPDGPAQVPAQVPDAAGAGAPMWFRRGPSPGMMAKSAGRAALRIARRPVTAIEARISYWRALRRGRTEFVRQRIAGDAPLGPDTARVAVFVGYDRDGVLQDYVVRYLEALREAGFAVLYVSNSPTLRDEDLPRLKALCGLVLHRENVGYDFGAYRDGIAAALALPGLSELLICNDSVYGPLRPLADLVGPGRVAWDKADVWGMTDSWDRAFHLQSYFVLFGPRALENPAFRDFWARLPYVQSKHWVSQRYEVGLTRALMAGGLRPAAFFPYRAVSRSIARAALAADRSGAEPATWLDQHRRVLAEYVDRGIALNPTHVFWRHLIEGFGFPFLKRELVQVNPLGLPGVVLWEDVVRAAGGYDPDLVTRHLERRVAGRAP